MHRLIKKAVTHKHVPSNILLDVQTKLKQGSLHLMPPSTSSDPPPEKKFNANAVRQHLLQKFRKSCWIRETFEIGIAWKPQSWAAQEKVDLNLEICFLPLPQQTKEFWGEITATEKSRMYRMQSKQMAGNGKMGWARPRDFDMCCCICLFTWLCCLEFPSRKSAASSSVQVGP